MSLADCRCTTTRSTNILPASPRRPRDLLLLLSVLSLKSALGHTWPFLRTAVTPPAPQPHCCHSSITRASHTMPSSRQFKAIGLCALLTVLVLYYVTSGPRLTHDSEFYKKTVAAIEHRKDAEARQHIIEEEKQRLERVERLQKEHEAAMASATTDVMAAATSKAAAGPAPEKQKPIVAEGEKSVAGRKKMKDGKVVDEKPAKDNDDGVAKVGNVAPKQTSVAGTESTEESEEEHQIELELNTILKKGPIIIFSKSYCPFSKKAKVSSPFLNAREILDAETDSHTAHPPRTIHNHARTLRRRTRPTRPRPWPAGRPQKVHGPPHRAQRPHQRQVHRRRRRHPGAARQRQAHRHRHFHGRQAHHVHCRRGRAQDQA